MAWAKCPTHGPIQDARLVVYGPGGPPGVLYCSCGLPCDEFEPDGFVEHDELVELAKSHRQPREDHVPSEAPQMLDIASYHTGGGWYTLPNGDRVQGRSEALKVLLSLPHAEG